jgi:hypothetical protein
MPRRLFTRKETLMSSAKLAVPTMLAVVAVVFAMKAGGLGSEGHAASAAPAAPTPYSADHSRIPGSEAAEEPAPTF